MAIINIRESLLALDKKTSGKYELTTLYEACKLDEKDKEQLVKYIDTKEPPFMIGQFLTDKCANCLGEAVEDDATEADKMKFIDDINDGADHSLWALMDDADDKDNKLTEATIEGTDCNNSKQVRTYLYDKIRKFDEFTDDNSRYWDLDLGISEGDDAVLIPDGSKAPDSAKYMFSFVNDEIDIDIFLDRMSDNDTWYVVDKSIVAEGLIGDISVPINITANNNKVPFLGGTINEDYDVVKMNDKYFPRVDIEDKARYDYVQFKGRDFAYDKQDNVLHLLFKDEEEIEVMGGIENTPFRSLDAAGLSLDSWTDTETRDQYLNDYANDIDEETSYLVQDFIQNELPYYQKQGLVDSLDTEDLREDTKDIDAILDTLGGADKVKARIEETRRAYPGIEDDELIDMLWNDGSREDWEQAVEYLSESTLTEAPDVTLSDDDMWDPSSISLKGLAKKAVDKEKAEIAEKERQERMAAAREKYKDVFDIIAEKGSITDIMNKLHELLVPDSGEAETVAGELVRAMMRIMYRDWNDGDKFFGGYGLETCGSSAEFLLDKGFDRVAAIVDEGIRLMDNDDAYTEAINELANDVIQYINNNPDCVGELNEVDSRDYKVDFIEENQPMYDYDFMLPYEVQKFLEAGHITSREIESIIEDNLDSNRIKYSSIDCSGSGDYVYIYELNYDDYKQCEDFEMYDDSYWNYQISEWTDEYGDPDEEDEEEDEDDDIDEAVATLEKPKKDLTQIEGTIASVLNAHKDEIDACGLDANAIKACVTRILSSGEVKGDPAAKKAIMIINNCRGLNQLLSTLTGYMTGINAITNSKTRARNKAVNESVDNITNVVASVEEATTLTDIKTALEGLSATTLADVNMSLVNKGADITDIEEYKVALIQTLRDLNNNNIVEDANNRIDAIIEKVECLYKDACQEVAEQANKLNGSIDVQSVSTGLLSKVTNSFVSYAKKNPNFTAEDVAYDCWGIDSIVETSNDAWYIEAWVRMENWIVPRAYCVFESGNNVFRNARKIEYGRKGEIMNLHTVEYNRKSEQCDQDELNESNNMNYKVFDKDGNEIEPPHGRCEHCGKPLIAGEGEDPHCSSCDRRSYDDDYTKLDEATDDNNIILTADEMKDKFGTDNPDIINTGRPEEDGTVVLKEEEEDKPYTHQQIFDELKLETKNFTVEKDCGRYGFKEEAEMAVKILEKHYASVELDTVGSWFQVDFKDPLNK